MSEHTAGAEHAGVAESVTEPAPEQGPSAEESRDEQVSTTTEAEAEAQPGAEQAAESSPATIAPEPGRSERSNRKVRQGYVVSDKMDKTVVVELQDRVKHALYGKVLRRSSKVQAHDEQNTVGVGDLVVIMETRPLSATKRWRVVEILEKAK